MITLARIDELRQEIKHGLTFLEQTVPGADVDALHEALAAADTALMTVAQRVWGQGPQPLDGTPKT